MMGTTALIRPSGMYDMLLLAVSGIACLVLNQSMLPHYSNLVGEQVYDEKETTSFLKLKNATTATAETEVVQSFSESKEGLIRRKSTITYLYYQHIRKCGGGVGYKLTENTTGINVWNEYHAFPTSCLDASGASQTLFFTFLRDPAERYASEFRYQGLHGANVYNLINATAERAREAVRHWVSNLDSCIKPKIKRRWNVRCFYPNLYVRLFSGKERCKVYEAPANTSLSDMQWFYAGSKIELDPVTEQDYLVALNVLKRFDLVLTTKKLGPSATERAINAGLNVNRDSAWNGTVHATSNSFNILSFEGVREILEEHLQFDMKLFKYFDSIQ